MHSLYNYAFWRRRVSRENLRVPFGDAVGQVGSARTPGTACNGSAGGGVLEETS